MGKCEPVKPLLYRVAECDASPEEAMRVARHLPDCTACRILLARERRLAAMLEQDLQDLPADEEFVRSVMETLPADPPRPRARQRSRRGLKLALLAVLLYGGLLALSQGGLGVGRGAAAPSLPSLDPPSAQGAGEGLLQVVYLAATALRTAATQLPLSLPAAGGALHALLLLGLLSGALLLAGSTLLAFAARSLTRQA